MIAKTGSREEHRERKNGKWEQNRERVINEVTDRSTVKLLL